MMLRYHADRTIVLEDGGANLAQVIVASFVNRRDEFLTRDLILGENLPADLAVVKEHLRASIDEFLHRLAGGGDLTDGPVGCYQRDCEDESRGDRVVPLRSLSFEPRCSKPSIGLDQRDSSGRSVVFPKRAGEGSERYR